MAEYTPVAPSCQNRVYYDYFHVFAIVCQAVAFNGFSSSGNRQPATQPLSLLTLHWNSFFVFSAPLECGCYFYLWQFIRGKCARHLLSISFINFEYQIDTRTTVSLCHFMELDVGAREIMNTSTMCSCVYSFAFAKMRAGQIEGRRETE